MHTPTQVCISSHFISQLLDWLAAKLADSKKVPKSDMMESVPLLYACLEDRSADVRKAANQALFSYMLHCGYESMASKTSTVKVG